MILQKLSSALAHLEDISPAEMKELSDKAEGELKSAIDLLNEVVYALIHARRPEAP